MQLLETVALGEGWFKRKPKQPEYESSEKKMFSQLAKWMEKPFSIDEDDESNLGIFYLAQCLKIPESKIVDVLLDRGDGAKGKIEHALSLLPMISENYTQEQKELLAKTIPEFESGDPVYFIYIAIDKREESILYSEKAKSFISFYQIPMKVKKVSLYQAIKKHNDMFPDRFGLETADEELGYYRLQKPPVGVVPKEYPIHEDATMQLIEQLALCEEILYEGLFAKKSKSPDYNKFIEMAQFIVDRGKMSEAAKFTEKNNKAIEKMKKSQPKQIQIKHTMSDVLDPKVVARVSDVRGEDLMNQVCKKFNLTLDDDWEIYGDASTEVNRQRTAKGTLGSTPVGMQVVVRLYKHVDLAVWNFNLYIGK